MGTDDGVRVTDRVSEIETKLSDPTVPCAAATAELGGEFELEEVIPRGEGCYAEYYSVDGMDLDELLDYASDHAESEAQFLSRDGDSGLLEMVVTGDCPAMTLAELGALPRSLRAVHGVLRIVAEVPPQYDEAEITAEFFDAYPEADLVAKREKSYFTPLFGQRQLDQAVGEALTDRQREAVKAASEQGYYDWPRRVTQDELAEELGVATPTLAQHLRLAEQKIMQVVFDGEERQQATPNTKESA